MSSNPVHGEMYSIQHYVIKFVSDLPQVGGSLGTLVSSNNKTDHHDITEILLKVALNTINQTFNKISQYQWNHGLTNVTHLAKLLYSSVSYLNTTDFYFGDQNTLHLYITYTYPTIHHQQFSL